MSQDGVRDDGVDDAELATDPTAPTGAHTRARRWDAVEACFAQAVRLPPDERRRFLDAEVAEPAVRAEVEALLSAHDDRGVLDSLLDDVMTPLLEPGTLRVDPTDAFAADSRYRVLERLGGGGMGVVYRARDERLQRDVALKFLPPHLMADPDAKRRFLLEARAAAALEHPNICTVHEIGETADGRLYIVMACYDGETLDRRIARGPMPVPEALRVAGEIARGLAKAHERGIVHRDIKPANVMVTDDGLVKVLDFGIAKLADVSVTRTTGAIGTLAYMSPEQAFAEPLDHRTDLWSLGVVVYEMLAGVRPFRGDGEQAVLMAALTAEPEPLSLRRSDVSPELDAVVRRALSKKADDRFASALEFAAALAVRPMERTAARDVVGDHGTMADTAPRGATARPRDAGDRDSTLSRAGERRQVTIVVSALSGYDTLVDRLSPETADEWLANVREAAERTAARHGGIVNQFSVEGCMLLFGVPMAQEDDAVQGVRTALALHAEVAALSAALDPRLATDLHLRTGVHVGAVVTQRLPAGDRRYRIAGRATDMAARLAAAAAPGEVLLSAEARRVVAPFVRTEPTAPLALPGAREPITPYRALGETDARTRLDGASREALTPFVGRERERRALSEHLESARSGAGRVTVLVAEAGAGKSRLLHELHTTATADACRVLVGRCDPYGGSTPFLPFIEAAGEALAIPRSADAADRHEAVVRAVRAIDDSLVDYLPLYLALLGIPSATHKVPEHLRGELFQAAMLEALSALFTLGARDEPTVLLFEDWHWADEGSRAAVRQLAEIVAGFPLLLVVTSRPDGTAEWGSDEHLTVLHLSPLDGDAAAAIARAVLGADRVAPSLMRRLAERTGGNPFFLEEVCVALREEGAILVRDGEAVASGAEDALSVPETVQGVLRTRMDRLDPDARDVLRVASVIGREFTRGVLEDVVDAAIALTPTIDRLKGSGLVQQVTVVPEPSYRFKHALTEEVAYDSLLERQRATLHDAVGRAIERRYATRLDRHAARLAEHFTRAEAWPEAVRYGIMAADRAMELSQYTEALQALERVEQQVQRLPDDVTRRDQHADVLLRQERLCEALGLRHRQLALVETLIALLASHGPSERLAQSYLRQGDAYTLLRRFEAADRSVGTALEITRELGDATGERNALRSLSFLRGHEGRHGEALALIEQVLALGRMAGDSRAEAGDLASLANILRALGEHERALEVLQAALERTEEAINPVRYGALLNVIGTVHRDLGHHDEALHYFRRTASLMTHPVYASFSLPLIAHLQLQQGDVESALATYREAVELNRRARYADGLAHASRSLGEVLHGLERYDEAVPYLREAARTFQQLDDQATEALMCRRLANALETLRNSAAAEEAWARVETLARLEGDLTLQAEAVEGRARAEREQRGPSDAAVQQYGEALSLWQRVGDRRRELGVRNALGIVHWQRGAFSEAVGHYEAALRLCREDGDRAHEGLILNSLGATLHRLRRWDEARTVLADALRVTDASGEQQLAAHALATLGDVCLASRRFEEARTSVERSLALRRVLGDRRGEGWMLERQARVLRELGAPDEARRCAEQARAIAEELGEPALTAAATLLLST